VHIILILDATFVPNLMFLRLSPEISLGEKPVTQLTLQSVNLENTFEVNFDNVTVLSVYVIHLRFSELHDMQSPFSKTV